MSRSEMDVFLGGGGGLFGVPIVPIGATCTYHEKILVADYVFILHGSKSIRTTFLIALPCAGTHRPAGLAVKCPPRSSLNNSRFLFVPDLDIFTLRLENIAQRHHGTSSRIDPGS